MIQLQSIQNRIYYLRQERVMLDVDLALLYEVETRALNQAVKRNISRFPSDFMFQLTAEEWQLLWSQTVTTSEQPDSGLIISKTQNRRRADNLPYAFTEQGVAMLSGILRSEKAVQMNIAIMRAFVEVRKVLLLQQDMQEQLKQIKERLTEHDVQLSHIYDALENLLDGQAAKQKWDNRTRIGFRK